jgi:hypothetical protein
LHSGISKLKWHSRALPPGGSAADPISSAIFVFFVGKQIRRYLSGIMFANKEKQLFVQIKECTPEAQWENAAEGNYVRAYPGARLVCANGGDLSLKPGLYSLQQIIRGFYMKRIEQISGKEFARQHQTPFYRRYLL